MEIYRQFTANNVIVQEYPFWKEITMEAYLMENEGILKLDDQNFSEVSILDAEIALKEGRKDSDGRVDLLAQYGGEYLAIIELKIKEVNESSLIQLQEYLDAKNKILEIGNNTYWKEDTIAKWVGVLIGTSICPLLQNKIEQGYTYNGIPIAAMTLRRFRSDSNEIFVISDTYFKFNYSSRDYSKFIFEGKLFNKSRLVNAVLKSYLRQNPQITFSELKNVFPDNIQGSNGVFTTTTDAEEIYRRTNHIRFYIKDNENISLTDGTSISTSTQWTSETIKKFIEKANSLGQSIMVE